MTHHLKNICIGLMLLMAAACGDNHNDKNDTQMKTIDNQCINASPAELAGIRKTLDLYTEAAIKADSKIAEPAFAETATLSYNDNGKLVSVPIKALFDYYDNECPQQASYEISACSVADDAAIVRIESVFGDTEFADMFSMVKDGDDWKIISKIYHVK